MSESWPLRRIDEVATIFDGPHATPKKTASGPWFLSISSLVNGRLELSGSAHLNQADFSRWTRRVEPRPGDVLISYETRLGEAALMPVGVRGCLGRRMALLRPLDGIDPRFLLYAYLGADFQEEIDRRTVHGATVDRIPLNELGEWPIRIPLDRHAQESIAEVLGSIDDAIQVNRHTEELCWRYAEVAFEKEAAKAEVRVTLGSVLDLAYGKALPARSRRVGPVPVFGSGGIVGWHDRPLVAGPGVVVGRKGTVGSVHWSQSDFFPIDTTFYVANAKMPMVYAHQLLRSLGLENMNSDSAVPGLNRSAALTRIVAVPSEGRLTAFRDQVVPLVRLSEHLRRETAALGALRDTLLPELLSGRIRVRDIPEREEELLA